MLARVLYAPSLRSLENGVAGLSSPPSWQSRAAVSCCRTSHSLKAFSFAVTRAPASVRSTIRVCLGSLAMTLQRREALADQIVATQPTLRAFVRDMTTDLAT